MSDTGQSAPRLRFGRTLRYGLESVAFFLFMSLFRIIGVDAASAAGSFIGRHIFYRTGVNRRARENLRTAYPEKPAAEIETILLRMWDNLGRTVSEYAHLDKFSIHGPNPRLVVKGSENSNREFSAGRGVLFFSGHFANWEIMPFVAAQLGYEGGEVYRPLNNPTINRWIVAQRIKYGVKNQIEKGSRGTRQIFTTLRRGRGIFLLADQKTNEGVPAVFFGREAMTTPAPAAIALKLDTALIAASNRRTGGAYFEMTVHPPLQFSPSGDYDRDVRNLTRAITAKIEEIVRADPAQWLWIHRRWPTPRDTMTGKRGVQSQIQILGGAGVRVESDGSSFT